MSDSDFDRAFGGNGAPRFAERVGRATSAEVSADTPEGGIYRAFGQLATGDVSETCDVRRWLDGTDMPEGIEFQYRFLTQIAYVGEEEIRLFLPDCIIVIAGKRLRDLRKKLARRQVSFMQQFSARVWPSAPSTGEPMIDSIKVIRPGVEPS